MNTHIPPAWSRLKQPILVGFVCLCAGAIWGTVSLPSQPSSCSVPASLHAHFLERTTREGGHSSVPPSIVLRPMRRTAKALERRAARIALRSVSTTVSSSASSAETLRGAAPDAMPTTHTPSAFPYFGRAVFPVEAAPNWGNMRTPAEWNRTYDELTPADFVSIPSYDLHDLTIPLETLRRTRNDPDTINILTEKLFYSTRHFGSYSIDADEFTGTHIGIDLKIAEGTPVRSVGGGRVNVVHADRDGLGIHVIVEHRIGTETFYSIYGHLRETSVREGQDLAAGDVLGRSGSTGTSTAPHLHFQVDRGQPEETPHAVYWPASVQEPTEASLRTIHPIEFIQEHR